MKSTTEVFDEIASAIKGAKASADEMSRLNEAIREQLDQFEDHLRKILEMQKIVDGAPEALKLFDRVARLRELRNMMELGSLKITTDRSMDAIWKRLP